MTGTVFSYLFPGDWNYTWEFLGKEKLSEFCGVQKQCVMDGTRSIKAIDGLSPKCPSPPYPSFPHQKLNGLKQSGEEGGKSAFPVSSYFSLLCDL